MEDSEHFYRCSHTYLHKAEASVSNEDRPHGTTAHTCCTVASSGTNYKDKQRDKVHRVANTERTFNQMCRKLFYPEFVLSIAQFDSLSWTTAIAVALLQICNVSLVPDQFI